jgi:hypothetical protein
MIKYRISKAKFNKCRAARFPELTPMDANRAICEFLRIEMRSLFEYTRGGSAVNGSVLIHLMELFNVDFPELVVPVEATLDAHDD